MTKRFAKGEFSTELVNQLKGALLKKGGRVKWATVLKIACFALKPFSKLFVGLQAHRIE